MKTTDNSFLEQRQKITSDYQARFDNYSDQTAKLASQTGAGRAFGAALQAALDAGKPMDFIAFGEQLLAPSEDNPWVPESPSTGQTEV